LAAKVAATVALKDIAVVWVVRKPMEAHWVLAEPQRKQTLAVAVAVIAAAMPVVNPVSRMAEVSMGIRVVVVAQVGQHLTLCLQRTRKVSAQVMVCSQLLLRKPQQFPRQ
jgi:uncharacterized iron-regulated membrane protein